MEKSENVSKLLQSTAGKDNASLYQGMLPFSGLGFDLGQVLAVRVKVVRLDREARRPATPPPDAPLPSGRWLQLRLGREIRGR